MSSDVILLERIRILEHDRDRLTDELKKAQNTSIIIKRLISKIKPSAEVAGVMTGIVAVALIAAWGFGGYPTDIFYASIDSCFYGDVGIHQKYEWGKDPKLACVSVAEVDETVFTYQSIWGKFGE